MKTTSHAKMPGILARNLTRSVITGTALATLLLANTALANPIGGVVAAGSAVIVPTTATQLDINQSTNKAVINWSSFNIAPNETTNFNQPNAGSATLNRIGSANPSQILGNLNANGQVMLVNPNGVFFGNNAQVDVASLLATTADISDANFMSGKYAFSKTGKPNGQVENDGTITANNGGFVALVGPTATNNGTITANLGKVALAGTDVFTLDLVGDKLINFSLPSGVVKSGPAGNAASASNNGNIYADQGKVQLTSHAAKATVDSLVNMSGVIQARSGTTQKGSVYLSGADTTISGNMDVSGMGSAAGGKIEAHGVKSLAFTGDANASGGPSGGNGGGILMQGDTLALGGTANVGSPTGRGGTATFKAGNTFDIGSSEAYTIGDAVSHGGTVNVEANNTINVDSAIDGGSVITPLVTRRVAPPNVLNFGDSNNNGDLTINLNARIGVPAGTKLIGDGTQVNVTTDQASIQNGVDVASTAGADVAVADGTYDENVNVYKNDINLHAAGGPEDSGFMSVAYVPDHEGDGGYDSKPVINGYVNVTADNDTVDGFKIHGGSLNGDTVGVNVDGGSSANITNNSIALGEHGMGDMAMAAMTSNYSGEGQGSAQGTGIKLNDANNTVVDGNRVTGAETGVLVNNSDHASVSDNHIHASKTGVDIEDSSNVGVTGNTISGNAWGGGHHQNQESLVDENSSDGHGSGVVGINVDNGANVNVTGNTIKHEDTGIQLTDSANAKVKSNNISDVTNGTVGDNADNLVFDNNVVNGRGTSNGDGLFLIDSSNAKVTNNTVNAVKNKLHLLNSNTSVKTGNNF